MMQHTSLHLITERGLMISLSNNKKAEFPQFFFLPLPPPITGSVSFSLPIEIRSREEKRKKYGVPDIKILEKKKRWEDLNSF